MFDRNGREKSFGFIHRPHLRVAHDLVECQLVWDNVGGVIVETEAYAVEDDRACHTAFRPSARIFVEANQPGGLAKKLERATF